MSDDNEKLHEQSDAELIAMEDAEPAKHSRKLNQSADVPTSPTGNDGAADTPSTGGGGSTGDGGGVSQGGGSTGSGGGASQGGGTGN